jgi:hypothetical protein
VLRGYGAGNGGLDAIQASAGKRLMHLPRLRCGKSRLGLLQRCAVTVQCCAVTLRERPTLPIVECRAVTVREMTTSPIAQCRTVTVRETTTTTTTAIGVLRGCGAGNDDAVTVRETADSTRFGQARVNCCCRGQGAGNSWTLKFRSFLRLGYGAGNGEFGYRMSVC